MGEWQTKPLGEVIKLEYGKPLPKEDRRENGRYAAYGANGVKCRTDTYFFDRPSIIVGRKGSAGEVTLTEDLFWPLDVTYFVTFDECSYDLKFLYHCLKSLQLTKLAKGVKPGINRNDVYQIDFVFPPLPEQKRIVAILDEAFDAITTAVTNTEKNLANARELFESYLNSVLTRRGSGGAVIGGWQTIPLGEVIKLEYGKPLPKEDRTENGRYPAYGANGVKCQTDTYYFDRPSIIVGRKGSAGEITLTDGMFWPLDVTYFVTFDDSSYDLNFLYHCLKILQLPKLARGVKPGINRNDVYKIKFTFPPLPEQKRIVAILNELSDRTKCLEVIYQQKLTALAELKQSILQKAFAGELTADVSSVKVERVDAERPVRRSHAGAWER